VLDPLQITNIPRDLLGSSLHTLAAGEGRISNAMDAPLTRAWR
jgi:hypothetical protein